MVLVFREIEKCLDSIMSFGSLMNMPPPISLPVYNNINDMLHQCYTEIGEQSTLKAANETANVLKKGELANHKTINCQLSLDRTWQKRGHVSINGIVTVISKQNGKCLMFLHYPRNAEGV